MNELSANRFTVNIYDIFANFIPGSILIIGILLPYIGNSSLQNFTLFEGVIMLFAAFAIGGITQAIGSYTKYYQIRIPFDDFPSKQKGDTFCRFFARRILPFDYRVNKINEGLNGEGDEDNGLSPVEKAYFESCDDIFSMNPPQDKSESWGQLFKMCIAYLEISPHNRTLRIQAQHLAARGLYITFFVLSLFYLFVIITKSILRTSYFNYSVESILPIPVLLGFAIIYFFLGYIVYRRAIHFEKDVTTYLISEVVLSSKTKDGE